MAAGIALHLWQSTLVLVIAWLITLVFRRNAAEVRYGIWFGASIKFLVPFALLQLIGEYIGRTLPEPPDVDRALIETANAVFFPSIPDSVTIAEGTLLPIRIVLGAIWILGTAVYCLRWLLQWRAVRSTLAGCQQLSTNLPATVLIGPGDAAPGVFGIVRPVVIVPRKVLEELHAEQLQAVLAHEACHIQRHDNLTAAIHGCVEAIFWFYPPVRWIGANLLRERETACDEAVIQEGYEQRTYAESILNVCRLGVVAQFSGVAASTGGDLKQRVSSIMSAERVRPIDQGRFVLLLTAVVLAGFGPIGAGVVSGAVRTDLYSGPISFDAVKLEVATAAAWHSAQVDPDAGRLVLKNVSLRWLMQSAYPGARVNGDAAVIDHTHYDIEARWRQMGETSERHVYRELLRTILRTNFNVQIYVDERCDLQCN